jgi:hypothetical protein
VQVGELSERFLADTESLAFGANPITEDSGCF